MSRKPGPPQQKRPRLHRRAHDPNHLMKGVVEMSILKKRDGVWLIRWREGGRNRSLQVHGSRELAKKVERKKLSARDENRHLDVRREVNFRMPALIQRYRDQYA